MKILVTGSNGLLGQKLTSLIVSGKRAELVASSKGPNRYPVEEGYAYSSLDICNYEDVDKAVSAHRPDVIINTAAITNVDTCHTDRELCRSVNVEAVKNLVAICEREKLHLIHLSTDFVFDGQDGPYSEEAETNPISYYGETKRDAEDIVKAAACKWTIIRTILVYGVTLNMSRSNIVLWAKGSLENGTLIKVVNDQFRMPTLAEDLAEACILAAEKGAEGIYHISGKDMMSVYDLVLKVANFWHLDKTLIVPVSSATLNQEAKRPLRTGFILNKAYRELGYHPHSFQEGLEIVNDQLRN